MTIVHDRRVFIVLATYKPDNDLLRRQLASLASQTHRSIEVFVCCDGGASDELRALVAASGIRSVRIAGFEDRVGVHANFARGLREALVASKQDSDLFCFCDQDDRWHPNKVSSQVAAMMDGRTSLVHCDARVIDRQGTIVQPSLFKHEGRLRLASFADLLIANSVTGMTSMFRRDVAVAASSFPFSRCRYVLHDHWLALVASLMGPIGFIDAPLVDYTLHGENVIGPRRSRRVSLNWFFLRRRYVGRILREYSWRRSALQTLRRDFGKLPFAARELAAWPVRALFDDQTAVHSAFALSFRQRLRGEIKQANEIWRLALAKTLFRRKRSPAPQH